LYKETGTHSFSVVIAARNEENNIRACLDSVLTQSIDSTRYEVILVDDRSNDTTLAIAREYASQYSQLKVLHIAGVPQGVSPKKHAVSQGIAAASNEIVVFTDADCVVTPEWLQSIDSVFTGNTGLVQGITRYSYIDGLDKNFWGMQAVDFLSHGIVAASAIGAGIPVNSNANNFAFRKEAFRAVGGYDKAGRVVSGDDDLLLQRIWKSDKWKIRFMIEPRGAVSTLPTTTIKGVFEQRKRWGSKTVHYNGLQVAILSGIFLFYLSIFAAAIGGFFNHTLFLYAAGMLVLKMGGESVLMVPGTRIFKQQQLRRFIIPASLIQLPLVVCAVFSGVFGKFNWKEQSFSRTVKAARRERNKSVLK